MFLNIFAMDVIHTKRVPTGKAIVSGPLHKIKLVFNESRRTATISGNRPGSWSNGKVVFQYTDKAHFLRIEELIKIGKSKIEAFSTK
jgi:hypothetical protein